MFSLAGKVALVTGSSRGIGKAIIEQMANAGARVVVTSRKADACERVRAEFAARGQQAIAVPCNVGQKEDLSSTEGQARFIRRTRRLTIRDARPR